MDDEWVKFQVETYVIKNKGETDQRHNVLMSNYGPVLLLDLFVRGSFSGRILHSRMPLDPTHVRLKLLHACDPMACDLLTSALTMNSSHQP
jgi:hypothetical protein